jgi:hypothetical protein
MGNQSTGTTEKCPLCSIKRQIKKFMDSKICPDNNTGSNRRLWKN